jgi:hypothetical protein
MMTRFTMILGGALSVGLLVAALWVWQHAGDVVADAARPEVALWAVRSAAVAGAAVAQVIGLTFVVGALYDRDRFGDVLRGAAAVMSGIATVSAIALGLAGR